MLAEIAEIARGDCEEGHEPDDDDDEPLESRMRCPPLNPLS